MYLKKLDMQGFKSFTENTSLLFDSGVTSIVGPNGCGKSNIADAIRWVLGEQSMKAIRGNRMEDIIFTGTEFRRPLGFAEVSLTIDNSDKVLDLEFLEVTITRRFFRSGESEFFINKTPCRLKDINNLFLDTGVGRDGYSIIGQGRVDEILSTKSEDRRHIFEEASGIMKYKVRKEEGIKKLELTKQNLLRIDDILNELELQLEPLKQQSGTAKKYLLLRDRLKELEISAYINGIEKLQEEIKEHGEKYNNALANRTVLINRSRETSETIKDKSKLLKALENKLENSREAFHNLEASYEKTSNEINLNREKINNLKENINRVCNEQANLGEKVNSVMEKTCNYEIQLKELNEKSEKLRTVVEKKEKERQELILLLRDSEKDIEEMKTEHMNNLDLLSDKKVQIANIENHIDNIKIRNDEITNEINKLEAGLKKEETKKGLLEQESRLLDEKITTDVSSLNELISLKGELNRTLISENKKREAIKSDIQVKISRYKMLQEMEENLEGYNKTVKGFLRFCNENPSLHRGVRGALGQLISVEEKYETAIEMALGSGIQNIVAGNETDAKIAIEFLKKANLGRATFLPITSVNGYFLNQRIIDKIKDMPGFLGVASEFVKYDPQYRGIILHFLGRVVVTNDLDGGIAISKKFGHSFKIVTLEGDIFSTSGAMTGGSKAVYRHDILGRSRKIQVLKNTIKNLKLNLETLNNDINKITNKLSKISDEIQERQKNIKEKEMDKLRCENQLIYIIEDINNTRSKIKMLHQEYGQNFRQQGETVKELKKYEMELFKVEENIIELKNIIDKNQETQKDKMCMRDDILNEITNHKIDLNSYEENITNIKTNISSLLMEKEGLLYNVSLKSKEEKDAQDKIVLLERDNVRLGNLIENYQEEKIGRNMEIHKIIEEREVTEGELEESKDLTDELDKSISLLNEELTRLDIRKTRMEAELESVQNRLWDEYELTYTNSLEFKREIKNPSWLKKEINRCKEEIEKLGYVNILAIDEYKKTRERFQFISEQKTDMEESVEKLKKIISEIDVQMKQQFIESFDLINKNFNKVFMELFGGGMAKLALADKENILESGVEIHAQPPGKKLQNMLLLSGGERAFTAIALLFSILLLKPVSFCVLDEIEASLDESNVERFASYLKKLSKKTQFIVITHKKPTVESSDTIYGITMEEKGISKIISMKVNEKAS